MPEAGDRRRVRGDEGNGNEANDRTCRKYTYLLRGKVEENGNRNEKSGTEWLGSILQLQNKPETCSVRIDRC